MSDESAIIKILQDKLGNTKFVPEDVEVFEIDGKRIVTCMDTMVQCTDIPPKMNLADAARKSVIACVSDFAAKGVRPRYGIISVNVPKTTTPQKIANIGTGLKSACDEYGISILGGDVNSGQEIVFNVCLFGSASSIIRRNGANIGDLIFVTGPFGYASAGLQLFLGDKGKDDEFTNKAKRVFSRPKPKLDFGVGSGKYFSSAMDSSDGLAVTLNEMSRQSEKKFVIDDVLLTSDIQRYSELVDTSPDVLVYHGGEEYEFVFTTPRGNKEIIMNNALACKVPIIQIGHVVAGAGGDVFIRRNGKLSHLADFGWDSFK